MATDLWSGFYGAIGGFISAPLVMFYQIGLQEFKGLVVELEKHLEELDERAFLVLHAGEASRNEIDSTKLAMIHRKIITKLGALESRGMNSERVKRAMDRSDHLWEFVTGDNFIPENSDERKKNRNQLDYLAKDVLTTVQPHLFDPILAIFTQLKRFLQRFLNLPGTDRT